MTSTTSTSITPMFSIKNPDEELNNAGNQLILNINDEQTANQVLYNAEQEALNQADQNKLLLKKSYDQLLANVPKLTTFNAEFTEVSLGTKNASDLLARTLSSSAALVDSATTLSKNINQTAASLTTLSTSMGAVFSELSSISDSNFAGSADDIKDELIEVKGLVSELEIATINSINNTVELSKNALLGSLQNQMKSASADVDALNAGVSASVKDLQGGVTATLTAYMALIAKNYSSDANRIKYNIDLKAAAELQKFLNENPISANSKDGKTDKKDGDSKQQVLNTLLKKFNEESEKLKPEISKNKLKQDAFNMANDIYKSAFKYSKDAADNQNLFTTAKISLEEVKSNIDKLCRGVDDKAKSAKGNGKSSVIFDNQPIKDIIALIEKVLNEVKKISKIIDEIIEKIKSDNAALTGSLSSSVLIINQNVNSVVSDVVSILKPVFDGYKTSIKYKSDLLSVQEILDNAIAKMNANEINFNATKNDAESYCIKSKEISDESKSILLTSNKTLAETQLIVNDSKAALDAATTAVAATTAAAAPEKDAKVA